MFFIRNLVVIFICGFVSFLKFCIIYQTHIHRLNSVGFFSSRIFQTTGVRIRRVWISIRLWRRLYSTSNPESLNPQKYCFSPLCSNLSQSINVGKIILCFSVFSGGYPSSQLFLLYYARYFLWAIFQLSNLLYFLLLNWHPLMWLASNFRRIWINL